MTMRKARWIIFLVGVLLPYVVRLPRGLAWLGQYTEGGLAAWAFLQASNAVAWGAILALSFVYRRPISLLPAAILGFGFLAYAHHTLDLSADPQAAIALVFIPLRALLPIAAGAVVGYILDRVAIRRDAGP